MNYLDTLTNLYGEEVSVYQSRQTVFAIFDDGEKMQFSNYDNAVDSLYRLGYIF